MKNIKFNKNKIILIINSKRLMYFLDKQLGKNKRDILFLKYKSLSLSKVEIEFYNLFALEVYNLLDFVIHSDDNEFGSDVISIKQAMVMLKDNTWIKNIYSEDKRDIYNKLDYSKIKKLMKFKILAHQQDAFDFYNRAKHNLGYNGAMLDAAPGSGKTFTSLAIAETIHSDVIIVICPLPTVTRVWINSITEEVYKKPQTYVNLKDTEYKDEKFIICHYEALHKLKDTISNVKGKVTFIVDESHNFSNSKSDRVILLQDIIKESGTEDVILMSGTPIKAHAKEIIIIMDILDPKFKDKPREDFIKLYKNMNDLLNHTLSLRFKAYRVKITKESFTIPTLTTYKVNMAINNYEKYLLSSIKEDIKKYTKERLTYFEKNKELYKNRYFELYNKAKSLALKDGHDVDVFTQYEKDVEAIIVLYKEKRLFDETERLERVNTFERKVLNVYLFKEDKKLFKEAKTVYKYVALKIIGETLSNVIGKAREQCHVDMVKELEFKNIINTTEAKTIVFTKYIKVGEAVYEKVVKEKYHPLQVYGEHTKNLSSTVSKFSKDVNLNPLIATYQSLGTGVPLVMANVIIAIDLPYRAYSLEQALARISRLSQTRSCFFYYLVLDTGEEPNINSRNININRINNEIVAEITGFKNQDYLEDDENENVIDLTNIEDSLFVNKHINIKNNVFEIFTVNSKFNYIKNIF